MKTLVLPRPQAKHKDLRDYHVPTNAVIEFDEHGRPYEQTKHGRMMLSRKTPYHYTIKN